MKTRLLLMPLFVALVLSLAACGGGSSVPANAVAVVGGKAISLADFNSAFAQAEAISLAQTGQKLTAGTPQYTQAQNQIVAYLVEVAEVEQAAPSEGVSVTDAEVTAYINNAVKTYFGGSMAKFKAELKKQALSMQTARDEVRFTLLSGKIKKKVTASVTVTKAQEQAYYTQHLSQYKVAAQTSRSVEYILFMCAVRPSTTCPPAKNRAEKKIADKVEKKLQNGANFEAMAKQYSDDTTTAPTGGKFTLIKGSVAPAFATAGLSLATGKFSQPVDATSVANQGFGWFIIKALAKTVTTKAHTTTFAQAEPTIKQTLIGPPQDQLWNQWLSNLATQYKGKVSFQTGYAPPTTTALSTSQSITTG